MKKKIRVLYMVNVPAPYMVNYFNELGRYCNLTVIFEKATSTERDNSWKTYTFKNFKGIILKGLSTAPDMAFCPQIIKYLKKGQYDFIFSSAMATPTGVLAIMYMKLRGIPFYLESEGGFPKNGKGLKERIKKFVMSGALGYFSTTPIGDQYFLTYGADKNKLYKYPFTSLYARDILKEPINKEEKENIRKKLKITEPKMILAVGQFIHRKGFDLLIKAAGNIDKNIGVYIVGGTPAKEYLKVREYYNAINVHFEGFKNQSDLAQYYKAADLFVLPTREDIWGLVINEAMAFGLPIITTDHCIAGVELVDKSNGRIIPTDSVDKLADAITALFEDNVNLNLMGKKSLEKIQWYTFEKMAEIHMIFFETVLKNGEFNC